MMKAILLFSGILLFCTSLISQNVGIGTTAPTAKLSISADGIELAGSAASNLIRKRTRILYDFLGFARI